MSKKWLILLLFFTTVSVTGHAQSADDVFRYSLEYPSYDPVSLVMPAVSNASGFGGYQDNPASMALVNESFFSFDLSTRFIDETGHYLGNSTGFSDNQTSIGDLGFVYKVPTVRGSLVVGGGYSQTTDFNRAVSVSGYNDNSSITDFFADLPRDDDLNEAAFNAFAIEDVNEDSSVSIFRLGADFSDYPGINQDIEFTERGRMGEYSAFLATEVLKNVSFGASIGYLGGTYNYNREFLESDRRGNYDAAFIDSDGDGEFDTDIDRIYSSDNIEANIQAFSARLGVVFEPLEQLKIGASYAFPSNLHIDEDYNTQIRTTFDNGAETDLESAAGRFSYKVIRPQRMKGGLTAQANGLQFTATAEAVFHSDARIEFDELELNPDENAINQTVRSGLKDVINLRGGLQYKINEGQFVPRIGYAYFPNPQRRGFASERQFINGGFSAEITKGLKFDFGLQYSFWDDQNELYSTQNVREVIREEVTRLHVMAGLRMTL